MKKSIIVRLKSEGLHRWKDAKEKLPKVGFLSNPHRHLFHIEVEKRVDGYDRDIEFIDFKHQVMDYLAGKYAKDELDGICDYGEKSCEMIAKELLEVFDAQRVRVMEDGENGAEVVE